jgi:cell division protease FtsH
MQLPERDRFSMSKIEMESRLAILMGGRVAEELKFGMDNVTSGASSDIEQATKIARAMVTQYGLSEKLGPIAYAEDEGEVFLGQSIARSKSISGETSKIIEEEVRRLVDTGYQLARKILSETNAEDWEKLSQGLLEYETLTGAEIKALLNGERIIRDEPETPSGPPPSSVPSAGQPRQGPLGGPEPQGA